MCSQFQGLVSSLFVARQRDGAAASKIIAKVAMEQAAAAMGLQNCKCDKVAPHLAECQASQRKEVQYQRQLAAELRNRAPEKKFPLFCQIGSTRKAAKKWLNGQKSGPTDKKVDLNGQKSYPNGTKIVRWYHYFCPLVQFWFLVQAALFKIAKKNLAPKVFLKKKLAIKIWRFSVRRTVGV